MVHVRQQWNAKFTKSTLLAWRIGPCMVSEMGIHRACHNLSVYFTEFLQTVIEGKNLRRAHKCKVQRIEKENKVFSFVIRQLDLLDFPIDNGSPLPFRGRFGNDCLRPLQLVVPAVWPGVRVHITSGKRVTRLLFPYGFTKSLTRNKGGTQGTECQQVPAGAHGCCLL